MTQRDKKELELYRRLAAINGRLEALRAIEEIEKDLLKRLPSVAPKDSETDLERCIRTNPLIRSIL